MCAYCLNPSKMRWGGFLHNEFYVFNQSVFYEFGVKGTRLDSWFALYRLENEEKHSLRFGS